MSSDAFAERGQAMEESYFRTKDAEMVEKLRKVFEADRTKEELAKASGIKNDEVLERLVRASVRGELLTAFKIYPLVEIVWADGGCSSKEAEAVIAAAAKVGLPQNSEPMQRLKEWIKNGPTPDGRAAWKMLAAELCKTLSAAELATFREDLLKHAKAVADASGGILDMFMTTSPEEKRVIEGIRKALTA